MHRWLKAKRDGAGCDVFGINSDDRIGHHGHSHIDCVDALFVRSDDIIHCGFEWIDKTFAPSITVNPSASNQSYCQLQRGLRERIAFTELRVEFDRPNCPPIGVMTIEPCPETFPPTHVNPVGVRLDHHRRHRRLVCLKQSSRFRHRHHRSSHRHRRRLGRRCSKGQWHHFHPCRVHPHRHCCLIQSRRSAWSACICVAPTPPSPRGYPLAAGIAPSLTRVSIRISSAHASAACSNNGDSPNWIRQCECPCASTAATSVASTSGSSTPPPL